MPDRSDSGAGRGAAVHEGSDGWLFLVGGRNRPLAAYGWSPRRLAALVLWAFAIARRARRARRLGIRFVQIVVPEKLSIYPERAPRLRLDAGRAPGRTLRRMLRRRPILLDPTAPLLARKAETAVYLRTDTHWTYEGCFAAYRALCEALDARPIDLADYPSAVHESAGDLGAKLRPPRREVHRSYDLRRRATRVFANRLVRSYEVRGEGHRLHRGAHVVFRNEHPEADPRRVVLFGDSCAHFEPIFLTGMLAETFRELHFVWSASLDWTYVERVRPDILLAEIAERFLARAPEGDRYDVEAAASGLPPAPEEALALTRELAPPPR